MNNLRYADRMVGVKGLETRELTNRLFDPDLISFSVGFPAPELFPVDELKRISLKVLEESGSDALQYLASEGFLPLRERIADWMGKLDVKTSADNVLIVNGSQQAIDFSGKMFLNPDDIVICEKPCYLGAIGAFRTYQCRFVSVPLDNNGMILEELDQALSSNPKAKMIYVTPDFQNPTGITWSAERRKEFLEVLEKYNLPVIEDNPYGELRYEGEKVPPIKSFDKEGRVIFLGTFSKILFPGMRIGWVCADKEIVKKYTLVKQSADLQCNSVSQREITLFLEEYDIESHIKKIIQLYKKRRDVMIQIIKDQFPPEVKYNVPEGGLFTWIELPKNMKARKLLEKALDEKVAFVPGESFYPNGGYENTIRLNFSNMPEERIIEGMSRLAKLITEEMGN